MGGTAEKKPPVLPVLLAVVASLVVYGVGLLLQTALVAENGSIAFWHQFQEGGMGMWVLLFIASVGFASVPIFGALLPLKPRFPGALAFTVPVIALCAGAFFFHRGMSLVVSAIQGGSIDDFTRLRIYAEGASEAIWPLVYSCSIAAAQLTALAVGFAVRSWTRSEAHRSGPALVVGFGSLLLSVAVLGWALVAVDTSSAAALTLPVICLCVGAALTRSVATDSATEGHLAVADLFAASACVLSAVVLTGIAFWSSTWARTFGALGGESVDPTVAPVIVAERLARSDSIVLLSATMVALVLVVTLAGGAHRIGLWARVLPSAALSALPVVVVAGLATLMVGGRRDSVQQMNRYALALAPDDVIAAVLPEADKAERLLRDGHADIAVGKQQVWVRTKTDWQAVGPASDLDGPDCLKLLDQATMLAEQAGEYVRELNVLLDRDASYRRMHCVALSMYTTAVEGGPWGRELEHPKLRFGIHYAETKRGKPILWRINGYDPALSEPYAALLSRPTVVRFDSERDWQDVREKMHVHLSRAQWVVYRLGEKEALSGELESRLKRLRELRGQSGYSVSADADVPALEVLAIAGHLPHGHLNLQDEPTDFEEMFQELERPESPSTDGLLGLPTRARAIVRFGEGSVSGSLPKEVIVRIVRQNFGRYRLCYEQGLKQNPNLRGKITVRWVIDRYGNVSNVANGGSSLPDSRVVNCVIRSFYGLSFPRPEGGIVTVTYPIEFKPG